MVYNGSGNSVTVTNLIEGKTYFFQVFEYTCYPPYYLTTTAYNNPNGYTLGAIVPTVRSVIANNVLKNQPALPEVFKFYDDQTPYTSNDPVRICADGSTSTYLKLNVSATTGIGLQITDNTGKVVADEKSSVDFSKYGTIGKLIVIDANNIEIAYTHPQFMEIQDKLYRELVMKITFNGVPISGISIPLYIYRASILLVPGLWNDEMDKIYNDVMVSKTQTSDLMLVTDYFESSSASFINNSIVVPEGIMSLFIKARNKNIQQGKLMLSVMEWEAHCPGTICRNLVILNTEMTSTG